MKCFLSREKVQREYFCKCREFFCTIGAYEKHFLAALQKISTTSSLFTFWSSSSTRKLHWINLRLNHFEFEWWKPKQGKNFLAAALFTQQIFFLRQQHRKLFYKHILLQQFFFSREILPSQRAQTIKAHWQASVSLFLPLRQFYHNSKALNGKFRAAERNFIPSSSCWFLLFVETWRRNFLNNINPMLLWGEFWKRKSCLLLYVSSDLKSQNYAS